MIAYVKKYVNPYAGKLARRPDLATHARRRPRRPARVLQAVPGRVGQGFATHPDFKATLEEVEGRLRDQHASVATPGAAPVVDPAPGAAPVVDAAPVSAPAPEPAPAAAGAGCL